MSLGDTRRGGEARTDPYVPSMPASTDPTDRQWPPTLITPNFQRFEFAQEAGYGCAAEPYPEALIKSCLLPMCQMLEVIRAKVQRPVIVICGWRSARYNEAKRQHELKTWGRTGVAEYSQHMRGRATDFEVRGMTGPELHALVLRLWRAGKLPDLGGLGRYPDFIHVDIRPHLAGELAQWDG